MYTETSLRDTEQLTLYIYCAKGLMTESSYVPNLRCFYNKYYNNHDNYYNTIIAYVYQSLIVDVLGLRFIP